MRFDSSFSVSFFLNTSVHPLPLASSTFSVKPNDFTVWRHTWRKKGVNCAVLTGNCAGLRTVLSNSLSHREQRISLREYHSFLSLPADTMMASSQGTSVSSNSFHRWASHDTFSNTTSYSKFYALLSSFRVTLWPMWLANSKRQACFYPPQSHAQEDTQNWQKKTDIPDGKSVLCQGTFSSVLRPVSYTVKLHSLS